MLPLAHLLLYSYASKLATQSHHPFHRVKFYSTVCNKYDLNVTATQPVDVPNICPCLLLVFANSFLPICSTQLFILASYFSQGSVGCAFIYEDQPKSVRYTCCFSLGWGLLFNNTVSIETI
jgi:hypothetical protein